MGAKTFGSIASWFGFTNVPVIVDHMPYTPKVFGDFATSEISAPIARLALDPKNELSVDPRIVGLDGTDEMSIESIVTRESYLTTFQWKENNASNDALFWALADPTLARRNGDTLWLTPMGHLSQMFENWTGDIEFRFVFQATKFHKGRVRIQFEPLTNLSGVGDTQTVTSTVVHDIGNSTDLTVRVPFNQAAQWLGVKTYRNNYTEAFGSVQPTNQVYQNNGKIGVFVQNALTGPAAVNDIFVSVFVRGCDNMSFANPREIRMTNSFATIVQTMEMDCRSECDVAPEGENVVWLADTQDVVDDSYGVYMGESILSIRQLMHRDYYYQSFSPINSDTTFMRADMLVYQRMYPMCPGNLGTTMHTTALGNGINYVGYHPVSWMGPAFMGMRGSMNWSVNTIGTLTGAVEIVRGIHTLNDYPLVDIRRLASTASQSSVGRFKLLNANTPLSASGLTLTNQRTMAGAAANVPYYSRARFSYTNPDETQFRSTAEGRDHLNTAQNVLIRIGSTPNASEFTSDANTIDIYLSAGHDFSLVMYKHAPAIFLGADSPPNSAP
jgi:hypothetical protein